MRRSPRSAGRYSLRGRRPLLLWRTRIAPDFSGMSHSARMPLACSFAGPPITWSTRGRSYPGRLPNMSTKSTSNSLLQEARPPRDGAGLHKHSLLSDYPQFHELSRAGRRFSSSSVPYYPQNASWANFDLIARKKRPYDALCGPFSGSDDLDTQKTGPPADTRARRGQPASLYVAVLQASCNSASHKTGEVCGPELGGLDSDRPQDVGVLDLIAWCSIRRRRS